MQNVERMAIAVALLLCSLIVYLSVKEPMKDDPWKIEKIGHGIAYSAYDVYCLAKNIYHEAATESDLGKYAVAQVTINRVKDGRWPRTVCDVVFEKNQFSWTNDKKLKTSKPRGELWEKSKEIAGDVLVRGAHVRALEDAVFYHADYVRPRWADNTAKIAHIDRHIFYHRAKQ